MKGLKGPLSCLSKARYGIAWGAIGAALDCYDSALRYSKQREQFGRPIAGFQLTQKKLAEMITEITKAQLLTWRLGTLMRHMMNLESVVTYEGTHDIHLLITGQDITGLNAFS